MKILISQDTKAVFEERKKMIKNRFLYDNNRYFLN